MKFFKSIMMGFLTSIILLSYTPQSNLVAAENSKSYDYRKVLQDIVRLHDKANEKFIERSHENPELIVHEFDPNSYFRVLKHLALPDKCVLDYVYWDGSNGRPYLYIRKISEKPFKSFEEYNTAIGWDEAHKEVEKIKKREPDSEDRRKNISETFKKLDDKEKIYLNSVRTDDSPEGFFELAVYHILAGQFYLQWHSCYNDRQIMVVKEDITKTIKDVSKEDFGTPMTWSQKRSANKIDTQPQIKLDKDTARVSLVVFTKWGGFIKRTFCFQRSYPHLLIKEEHETLVKYDCHVLF